MRQDLETKKTSLELKRKENKKRSNRISNFLLLLLFISISNTVYFKNPILLDTQLIFYPLIIGLFLMSWGLSPNGYEDNAFLKIMESLELLEKGQTDPEIRKHAAQKLEDATNTLEVYIGIETDQVSPLWHSKVNELEKDFIRKLKYRAVPALRDGRPASINMGSFTTHELEHIALVFIEQDTGQMKLVNDLLEDYDEIVINGKDKISINSFYRSQIGNPIIKFISAYSLLIGIVFLYTIIFNKNFYEVISDPTIFISGGLVAIALIDRIFRSRERNI